MLTRRKSRTPACLDGRERGTPPPSRCTADHAAPVPAGTGGERPRARRLLPADRARPVADLQRRRRGEPRARRVLRARRLRVARDRASTWASAPAVVLSPVAVALLGILFERFLLRRFYTADPILSLLVTFGLALVAEQAIRMIWGAAPLPASMPDGFKGSVDAGRLPVLALPPAAARRGGRGARRHLAAAPQDVLRPRGARRHPAARHGRGARHPAAALHDRRS